jgi:micrococcal nuclease
MKKRLAVPVKLATELLLCLSLCACLSAMPTEGKVTYVHDGDTLYVNGKKIRLIGVDTPELEWREKDIQEQCHGREATRFLKGLLMNQTVFLRSDAQTPEKDKYGRFLAYVYLGSRFINAELIEKGYGFAFVGLPYTKKEEFMALEAGAKARGEGLWGRCKLLCQRGICETGPAAEP